MSFIDLPVIVDEDGIQLLDTLIGIARSEGDRMSVIESAITAEKLSLYETAFQC